MYEQANEPEMLVLWNLVQHLSTVHPRLLHHVVLSNLQFRVAAKSMVDWICDYYQGVENLPVRSELSVGDVRSLLPPQAPVGPESWNKISQDFQEKIMPGEKRVIL